MRKLENINPELTSDLLRKCGFDFDGYYYTNPKVSFQFRKEEDGGFVPSMKDPGLPPINTKLVTYSGLMRFLGTALQFQISEDVRQGILKLNGPDDLPALNRYVREYYKFDSDLNYVITVAPEGIAIVPNNEYTFSLDNGTILKFRVHYKNPSGIMTPMIEVIECAPNCISWPFLVSYGKEVLGIENPEIEKVEMENEAGVVPFFGIGIPKLVGNR